MSINTFKIPVTSSALSFVVQHGTRWERTRCLWKCSPYNSARLHLQHTRTCTSCVSGTKTSVCGLHSECQITYNKSLFQVYGESCSRKLVLKCEESVSNLFWTVVFRSKSCKNTFDCFLVSSHNGTSIQRSITHLKVSSLRRLIGSRRIFQGAICEKNLERVTEEATSTLQVCPLEKKKKQMCY